jgi:inosine/xanthosine triphosphatase
MHQSTTKNTLALGSTGPEKIEATQRAIRHTSIFSRVQHVPCTSGVNEQPLGFSEMQQGAQHRALCATEMSHCPYGLGIENGIVETVPEMWFDFAVVCLWDSGAQQFFWAYSEGVPLHARHVATARQLCGGFAQHTVGEVLGQETGANPKDPHHALIGVPRTLLLQRAIRSVLWQLTRA